ncbi:MAG: phosphoribosylglycinamide formyltransferase [Verrucomicrobiales bacterium]|nr:phosphoribosylglycinamide formyltransferase [Verrucomicrobiales bacterium]
MNHHTGASLQNRIAILGSGRGSNARAILEAVACGQLSAEVALIISDRHDAGILEVAAAFGVPSSFVDPGDGKRGRISDEALQQITDQLLSDGVDWVVLAGFMKIVRNPLLRAFDGRILNLHPSLLPKYPGLNTVKRALEAGDAEAGCTIHLVDSGVDTGKILHQARVPIVSGDTVESVTAKIHAAEHLAYPMVIGRVIQQG